MACSSFSVISTSEELKAFLSSIKPGDTIYLDLEGKGLGRNRTITLATVLIHPQNLTHVIDVQTLGESAFGTKSEEGKSLKSMLEDPGVAKCMWDVRNTADTLWAHFRVALVGVTDIQLLENASRPDWADKNRLGGLENAVKHDIKLGFMDRERWIRTRREVRNSVHKDVFSTRPVASSTFQYCVNDVVHLPALRKYYMSRITQEWLAKAREESQRRLAEARSPRYEPQLPDEALGPWRSCTATALSLAEMVEVRWDQEYDDQEEEFDYCENYVICSAHVDDFEGRFDSC